MHNMSTDQKQPVPGYWQNPLGHLVPEDNISTIDKIRDDFVRGLVARAKQVSASVGQFKTSSMSEISKFVELAALDHGVVIGGQKGNITLTSFDGRFRVVRAIDESITFNEGMSTAREIIFKCIEAWSEGADPKLATLVTRAFERDKNGTVSTSRILALRSYEIDDQNWRKAMEMIAKSIQVQATIHYLRFYERDDNGRWIQIPLGPGLTA